MLSGIVMMMVASEKPELIRLTAKPGRRLEWSSGRLWSRVEEAHDRLKSDQTRDSARITAPMKPARSPSLPVSAEAKAGFIGMAAAIAIGQCGRRQRPPALVLMCRPWATGTMGSNRSTCRIARLSLASL